jgi:hypothetical protein
MARQDNRSAVCNVLLENFDDIRRRNWIHRFKRLIKYKQAGRMNHG